MAIQNKSYSLLDHQKQSAEVQGLTLTKAQADKYAQLYIAPLVSLTFHADHKQKE